MQHVKCNLREELVILPIDCPVRQDVQKAEGKDQLLIVECYTWWLAVSAISPGALAGVSRGGFGPEKL